MNGFGYVTVYTYTWSLWGVPVRFVEDIEHDHAYITN